MNALLSFVMVLLLLLKGRLEIMFNLQLVVLSVFFLKSIKIEALFLVGERKLLINEIGLARPTPKDCWLLNVSIYCAFK